MKLIIYFQEMWKLAIEGQTQGIWFCAVLYTLIVCAYSLIFQIRTRYWPFSYGDLAEIGTKQFGATDKIKSNQEYVSKALYKFNVSGVDYIGTRVSPWVFVVSHNVRAILEKQMSFIQRSPDRKIRVFYNPTNPRKSYLIVAGKMGILITLLISMLPIIAYYFKYYV